MLSLNNSAFIRFRQTFTIPAAFGSKHSVPASFFKIMSMSIPTRAQSWVLIGYGALNIILVMIKYTLFTPNNNFPTYKLQLLRYLADRCGVMAFTNFPALFLFAGRNNMMIWATGWSFDTFNVYHRWVARGMVAHSFIHAVCYSIDSVLLHEYEENFKDNYWRSGVAAMILGSLILLQSIHYLRSRWYEMFLAIHIIFAAVFIVACWFHVVKLGWHQWVWASVGIWAFDRVVRLFRLAWSGIGHADTQLYPGEVFKMTISTSGRFNYYPGCYAFIHVLTSWGFWESHPFTIYQHPDQQDKLVICGVAKGGMTRRVANKLASLSDGFNYFKLLLDGPYGHRHNLNHYNTCIFVAGGIGITSTYGYAADLLSRTDMAQNIIFIWITPHESSLNCFSQEIELISSNKRCAVEIYVTQTETLPIAESDTDYDKDKNADVTISSNQVTFIKGRPDAYGLVAEHIRNSKGATSIIVCGPPTLNDTLRTCAADNLGIGTGRIDYLEEGFSW